MQLTIEQVKYNLENNQKWLERGILAIYRYQTAHEKAVEGTVENNSVGFNGVDGQILSSFAKWIEGGERFGKQPGQCLTVKQLAIASRKMPKYAAQLLRIAQGEQ